MNLRLAALSGALMLSGALALAACNTRASQPPPTPLPPPQIEVIADGLFAPLGLAPLPDGGLLVAEEGTGKRDDSAGVTLITADGQIGRLISGLPSSRDSGDLAGVNLVSVAPDGDVLYVGNFGATHLWTLPLTDSGRGLALPPAPYSTFRIGVSGLGNGMTGWGAHWIDLDHDTDRDMLIVNGRAPVTNPLLGRGSALGDFDNDGDDARGACERALARRCGQRSGRDGGEPTAGDPTGTLMVAPFIRAAPVGRPAQRCAYAST
jgi:hypothetical protein